MPTLETLAEALSETGIAVATVDCTVEKKLCGSEGFGIRVSTTVRLCSFVRLCVLVHNSYCSLRAIMSRPWDAKR